MAAELSALHVFVYGGEYNDPLHGDINLKLANQIASLGAVLERSADWGGYIVKEIPICDPDFNRKFDFLYFSSAIGNFHMLKLKCIHSTFLYSTRWPNDLLSSQ